ncbi:PilZ domain-containing protein [Arhodomonas sp. AD133]|uniref:PilZ domain-containing protein n=1 Tax=Arhodomonas sp. AD133 TaxID=3415009 RepID=UPI003EB74B57
MSDSDFKRRRFHRVNVDRPAYLSGAGDQVSVRVIDLSLHGALVEAESAADALPESGELVIELDGEARIQMQVTAVHSHGSMVGLRCDGLPLDSAAHLRRLVELNLGDPSLLERDLEALATSGPGAENT